MTECLGKITANLLTVLKQSGHFVFQNGQYEECLQTKGFSYTNVQLGIGDVNYGLYMGLCLPEECTQNITKSLLDGVMKAVGLPYNVVAITQHIQDYSFPINWVFYITLLILLACFGFFVAGSILGDKIRSLKGFSLAQSLKIFKYNDKSDLNVFNGIRSLAMMWVVFGHYFLNSSTGVVNTFYIGDVFSKPLFLVIQAGLLSVDIFFFLGGFFLAFVFLRQKSTSIAKYLLAVVQRLLRIWPAYIFTMMSYYSIFMQLGSGPRWPSNGPIVNICKDMWRSILFLENFIDNGEQICIGWGWYLQVDFQLFIACLIILFIYSKTKIGSVLFTGLLIAGSFAININYTEEHKQKLFTNLTALLNFQNYFLDMYIKPYARCTPYFMGLFAGIAYFQFVQKAKEGRMRSSISIFLDGIKQKLVQMVWLRWLVEIIGLGIMVFLVFIPRTLQTGGEWPQIWHSFYFCFSKPLFIFGLLLVILPPLLGIKSFFRLLLDTSLFNFIAKISFCTYLVHLIVIYQFYTSLTYDIYYSIIDGFVLYTGCLVLSCLVGFIMTVLLELPCAYYQKELMNKIKNWNKGKENAEPNVSGETLQRGLINYTITSEQK